MSEVDPLAEIDPFWAHATDNQIPFGVGESEEVANWIGRVIFGYSAIEFQFFLNFALCSDEHSALLYHKFYSARAIHHKEELAIQAAALLPSEMQDANKKLWRHLRATADRRRQWAHSTIGRDDLGFIGIFPGRKSARFTRWNSNFFARTLSQFRTLQTDAHMFFVCLRLLDPCRAKKMVGELKLPRTIRTDVETEYHPGSLPLLVIEARNAALRRLGLTQLLIAESVYESHSPLQFRFHGQLVLWTMNSE